MKFLFIALFLLAGGAAEAQSPSAPPQSVGRCFGTGDVASGDGVLSARITRSGREPCGESKVEIFSTDGHLLSIVDYASPDGQSGLGVIQAQWSPDSQFLVFSLTQPPGRSDRPYTIAIYSTKKNKVKTLPAAKPEFTFTADALEIAGPDGQMAKLPLANP
jgi:hypothetical protein